MGKTTSLRALTYQKDYTTLNPAIPYRFGGSLGQTHLSRLLPQGGVNEGIKVGFCPTLIPSTPLFIGTHIQEQGKCNRPGGAFDIAVG
jgi:hypothetical protein